MRHARSVTRTIVVVLAASVSFGLLACGVAAGSITLFEPILFHPGSIDGQSGVGGFPWKSSPVGSIDCAGWPAQEPPLPTHAGQYDQAVEPNRLPASVGFGLQSLRISNACASGEFTNQTYSAKELVEVGEDRLKRVFMAQFSFMSKTPAHQPGLFVSVSPDSHEGSRMSWVGLADTPNGIQVSVADAPGVDGGFAHHDVGPLLSRTAPHTIRFWIKVNRGEDNDLVRIAIDGRDVGQCFATWENYYRTAPEQAPPPNVNTPADINSLQFRSSVPGPPELAASGGYLFDNVSMTPADGPAPPECPLVVEKEADAGTVRAGGLARYTIGVRNPGALSLRNVRVCDRVPRGMTFVGADRRLSRLGARRCFVIPSLRPGRRVRLHVRFRVDGSASTGTVANIAEVTPGVEPPGGSSLGTEDVPGPSTGGAREPVVKATAVVRVRERQFQPIVAG